MKLYTCSIDLNGDRNHVVNKSSVTAAELLVLQAVHGAASVHSIRKDPGEPNMKHADLQEMLSRKYGRTKAGPENDRRPVLVRVFPGWPNRPDFPLDAKAAGIDPLLMVGAQAPAPVVDDDEDEGGKPNVARQNTYWKLEDPEAETVYGMTEKGDVIPEGITQIKKADWEAEQKDTDLLG